jgi:hypothetical protein
MKLKWRIHREQDKYIHLSDIALANNHGSGVYFYAVAASVSQMMDTSFEYHFYMAGDISTVLPVLFCTI